MAKERKIENQSSIKAWEQDEGQASLRARTLQNNCPILLDFLSSDMKVLDVGCGPGTITLDVARKVTGGSVVGVDASETAIGHARSTVVESGLKNVDFRTGDAYSLDFSDDTFDLVYSNQVLEYLRRPADALREQARVTRPGGWVISMQRSWGFYVLYPPCPAYDRLVKALHRDGEDSYYNNLSSSEAVANLIQAGFGDYRIICFTPDVGLIHPKSEYFDHAYREFKGLLGHIGSNDDLRAQTAVDQDTIDAADAEVENWHRHPHALHLIPCIAACGHVE